MQGDPLHIRMRKFADDLERSGRERQFPKRWIMEAEALESELAYWRARAAELEYIRRLEEMA